MKILRLGLGPVLMVLVGTSCTVTEGEASNPSIAETATTESVTVVETTIETATSDITSTTIDTDGANPFGGDSPEDFLMPDVVCMTPQDAQDEIQDHGVFFSRSEDATGAGRLQLLDRNWIVVGQEPAPGQPVGELEAVLQVVKIGESTGGLC